MLDTNCRKFIQPFIRLGANIFIKLNITANQVTSIALIFGIASGLLIYLDFPYIAIALLWFSGYLDAVDGTIARHSGSTPFGTVMDITFDRIVEISLILGLALKNPNINFLLLCLACSIIISMTIFLVTGSLTTKKSEKSFYYQPGLAERTEGFIMFSLMIIFQTYLNYLTLIFIFIVLFTATQRFLEGKKILNKLS